MSIMLGLLIISLDSGILLFATKKLQEFGFRPNPHVDAMQLSATIFALYKSAACDNATSPGDLSISWVQQVSPLLLLSRKIVIGFSSFFCMTNRDVNIGYFMRLAIAALGF